MECDHTNTTNGRVTTHPEPLSSWEDEVMRGLQRVRQHTALLRSFVPPQFFDTMDAQQLTAALLQAEV